MNRRQFLTGASVAAVAAVGLKFLPKSARRSRIENPYLDAFTALPESYKRHGEPLTTGTELAREADYLAKRKELVLTYSWAVPTAGALETIAYHAKGRGIVDFGAGSGYWSHLLQQSGCDCVAIDNWTDKALAIHHPVLTGSFESLADHRERALLLVWPPHATLMARAALHAWGGRTLIFVGEPAPARGNADPAFFAELAANWTLADTTAIPQWFNRSDRLHVYHRA